MNLNRKKKKLWNTMEVSWFFLSGFFLYYSSSFPFDDDDATFFKEGVVGKNIISCYLNFKHRIINFCSHYCCYKTFELLSLLRKKYLGKMLATKMSYLQACN